MTTTTSAPPGLTIRIAAVQGLAPLAIDCRPSGANELRPSGAGPRRSAFTLIELMVAMTLTLFVMVILTQAFVTSLDVFDNLKGIGDMEAHLRTVATSLRNDLGQDHFEGKRRLSDPGIVQNPPKEGFMWIRQATSQSEGTDNDGIDSPASWIAGNAVSYHALYFTNRLRLNQQDKVYSTTVPGTSPLLTTSSNYFNQPPDGLFQPAGNRFNSPWGTVAYYLIRTGSTVELDNPASVDGTPLHALYRSECLVAPNVTDLNNLAAPGNPAQFIDQHAVSCWHDAGGTGKVFFNSPSDLADATRTGQRELKFAGLTGAGPLRHGSATTPPGGSTLLATNIVSFNVRVLPYFEADTTAGVQAVLSDTFRDLPHDFDTANPQQWAGRNYRVHAVEIILRVWDMKTEQARQITVVHAF